MTVPMTDGRRRSDAAVGPSVRVLSAALLALAFVMVLAPRAMALSEIKREDIPPPPTQTVPQQDPITTVPLPDPIQSPPAEDPQKTGPTTPGGATSPGDTTEPGDTVEPDGPATPDQATEPEGPSDPNAPLPEIVYDFERLPPEVKRMRELILEACRSGDPEKLRPLLGLGDDMTQLSLGDIDGDPITFIKQLSGDPEGVEILAIMEEVLNAGYVHLDAGTPEELYVWPYFFAVPLDRLTAPQKVELFKIITAGDYEEMKNFGSYIFYSVGITPQGKWAFFVAGE